LSTLTRALAMLALAALLVGLLGAAVIAGSGHVDHPALSIAASMGIGAAWIGTGLYAWWRRPQNRFGALMTWTGFAWLINAFTAADDPAVFTIAVLLSNVYIAAFVHLLVAYPDGRVTIRARKRLVALGYGLAVIGPLPMLMFGFDQIEPGAGYPRSILQISEDRTAGRILEGAVTLAAVALVVYLLWVLLRRLRAASPPSAGRWRPSSGRALR